jgi:hypothetical protein
MTASAFLLSADNGSSATEIVFGSPADRFTFVYDDSDSLDLDGNPSTKEVTLKSYNFNEDLVTVPSIYTDGNTGIQYKVTVIGTNAFFQKEHMVTLDMGENVKRIDASAFRECTGLKSLNLKNVTDVGYQAFMHCTSVTSITANYLETVGDYAFAILDVVNFIPYAGDIPLIATLSLPHVKTIGEGAFGAKVNTSLARDFNSISLPEVENIGPYAFNKSKIEVSFSIPAAETVGMFAFFFDAAADMDTAKIGYSLQLQSVTAIGNSAFTGRNIVSVTLPALQLYTIGNNVFEHTKLPYANLGMVSNIGVSAFDHIYALEYFTTAPDNPKYVSLISNPGSPGEEGALYRVDSGGNPDQLYKLPMLIKSKLQDSGNKFTVRDGVKQMTSSAFEKCPSISVDLNEIISVPVNAFSSSDVLEVSAKKVAAISSSAFTGCSSLTSFEFLDTGETLEIGEAAFYGTGLIEVILPEKTTIGSEAFASLRNVAELIGVWGDTKIKEDSFSGVSMEALRVSSNASTRSGAEAFYHDWNDKGWIYGSSEKVPLLQIYSEGGVKISDLKPDGQGRIQIMNMATFSTDSSLTGDLQFVEFKSLRDPQFHMISVKSGIYAAETHGSLGDGIKIADNVNGNTYTNGKEAYSGDGVTWELITEYYLIIFYTFPTDGDEDDDGIEDGQDPDYINPELTGSDVSTRTYYTVGSYLAGRDLKSMLWQSFVRYSLAGWYVGDDPDHNLVSNMTNNRVTSSDAFGRSIQDSWIFRDSVTDEGWLNLYARFMGKEYNIQTEARLTGGQNTTGNSDDPNGIGGSVQLILDPLVPGYDGFETGTGGAGQGSYPFGTSITLNAIPNAGYAFVGWGVIEMAEGEEGSTAHPLFTIKSDRSYLDKTGIDRIAVWTFDLPSQIKYVAYFAKTTTVNFDQNKANAVNSSKEYVIGDRLVENNNDYNGYDWDALVEDPAGTVGQNGKGISSYPSTPVNTDLTFGGWYYNTTAYALYDSTDAAFPGTYLKTLQIIPTTPNPLTLVAKWYATITFYPDDGTNDASLTGTGLTETGSGTGVYTYQHDAGKYAAGTGYNGAFDYGVALSPTAPDMAFNGWYVLSGGNTFSDIDTVTAGTNSGTPYPDIYGTKKRLQPGTLVDGHTSLMALYVANAEFYFNGADSIDTSVSLPSPYSVTVGVSEPVYLGSSPFDAVNAAMLSTNTYKSDTKDSKMEFMGWYVSADGSTSPVATDAKYSSTTQITGNVKLIAGWGVSVTFSADGLSSIDDTGTGDEWISSDYAFTVLEGTVFEVDYDSGSAGECMPVLTSGGESPTSWYDGVSHPYIWYTDGVTKYTYSVVLTPEFGDLFQFNTMGGNTGIVYVAYYSSETFGDVLEHFYDNINDAGTYVNPTKTGLYYEDDGTVITPGQKPNTVWYKDDGDTATENPNIVYVGNQSTLVKWDLEDPVSASNAYAYIRWLADVNFDRNVPYTSADTGTTANPVSITGIDEGTPFSSLSGDMPAVPQYNTANDKTFRGWYVGTTQYGLPDGTVYTGAPGVTGTVELVAKWNVEVKFYYTGTLTNATVGTVGTDAVGSYIIIDVGTANKVSAVPSVSKTNFTNNHVFWYENGFDGTVPINVSSMASPPSEAFDLTQDIMVNKTLYVRWYAVVDFSVDHTVGGFFGTVSKNLLEGSKLSDLPEDLDPYSSSMQHADWEFIGWFKAPLTADYEDLGTPYYRTEFDYLPDDGITPSDSASSLISGNVTLHWEYVVQVSFDPGYEGAAPIDSQYLRVDEPLPASGDRFTAKPLRDGVAFTGWYNVLLGKKYTENVHNSDVPNSELVSNSMTLTATWLVVVKFYDLDQYRMNGLQIALSAAVTLNVGPDRLQDTDDDFLEMPEGTQIRQFVTSDPYVAGKSFVSWFAEQEQYASGAPDGLYSDGDTSYGLSDRILGDVILTAGYGISLHFDTNGGTPSSIPDVLVIEGQSITLPEKPAKSRLTFSGWDDGLTVLDAGDTVTPVSEITFSAKWLVVVKIYDGISMTPVASMQWDEDAGPDFGYDVVTSSDYDGYVIKAEISWTDSAGSHGVTLEKFIDRYDSSAGDWVSLYSVFDGWIDPFTGTKLSPTADLEDLFAGYADSAALFATWKERVRFYDGDVLLRTDYVESGAYLGTKAQSAAEWSDLYNPTVPLNSGTYRILSSGDFLAIEFITVTFNGNGGTPQLQTFSDVISGQMLGLISGLSEPTRSGMYFAGWYLGDTRYSFTDKLYGNAELTARWESAPVERYTVFAAAYDGASISPSGMIKVMRGDSVFFDFNVVRGDSPVVLIDGQRINSEGMSSYVFSNVMSDRSIEILTEPDLRDAAAFLSVDISGKGDVLYSSDNGTSFRMYTAPLPIYEGLDYVLEAVPASSSHFDRWSGDVSGSDPRVYIVADGSRSFNVTAEFGSQSEFFGTGELGIANLICMIISIAIGLSAVAVARRKDCESNGTGKVLMCGVLVAVFISAVLFFLTQGFSGQCIVYDKWSIAMAVLTAAALVMTLAGAKYGCKRKQ